LPAINQTPQVFSVSQLTRKIQGVLEGGFDTIWIEGEISNFRAPVSGHYYMVLKDERAQIKAVMFRSQAQSLQFAPKNGLKVLVRGKISVYAPRGEYQIILDYLEPLGAGALALAFEQLKKKLAAEGLFAREIKRPMPSLPQRIAVITSPTGAAIRDFLKIINRRFTNIEIIIVPVRVQGEEASADMVKALDLVNRELKVDVIVLTRGGGSLEDLWAFNNEDLALAIRRSQIPVMSAVGHEIDLTISDLAADFRAPTPSAAAELLVAEKESLINHINDAKSRLISSIKKVILLQQRDLAHYIRLIQDPKKRLSNTWIRLDELQSMLLREQQLVTRSKQQALNSECRALTLNSPANIIIALKQQLTFLKHSFGQALHKRLTEIRAPLFMLEKRINDLAPTSVLERGYCVLQKLPERTRVTTAASVNKGNHVQVTLSEGKLECTVDEVIVIPKK